MSVVASSRLWGTLASAAVLARSLADRQEGEQFAEQICAAIVGSQSGNLNSTYDDVSRTLVQVTGDVRPDGSWAPIGRHSASTNLTGYFAKFHRMRPEKALPRVAKNLRFWAPLHSR